MHSERKQQLPQRGTVQQGMEERTQRSHPETSKMLGEQDHPTQVIFHNHREVFTPPPAWGSAAWAEPLGLSPPCTGCSSSGEVRVPSPFQQSAADGARYVLRATITRGNSQRWSQQGLPSGGQPRSALSESGSTALPSQCIPPSSCRGARQDGISGVEAEGHSSKQQAAASWGTGSTTGLARTKPHGRALQSRGGTSRVQVGAGVHPTGTF